MDQFPLKHSANAEQQQRQQSRHSPMHVQHWQQHKTTAAFSSVVADGVSPCCSLASGCCVTTSLGAVPAIPLLLEMRTSYLAKALPALSNDYK